MVAADFDAYSCGRENVFQHLAPVVLEDVFGHDCPESYTFSDKITSFFWWFRFSLQGSNSVGLRAGQQQYDEKNIRRRVYDALNVLMAMGIIFKDKKDIQWKGLPSASLDDVADLKVFLALFVALYLSEFFYLLLLPFQQLPHADFIMFFLRK